MGPVVACVCGCCRGLGTVTPLEILNRPGLGTIAYRVGTHGSFKQSMLAGLSRNDRPKLADLGSRDDDDLSIALIDGWATVADVLTFYQERIVNESYLLTASERRSLVELGRLIDYEPRPGVAAATWLAFELETAQGAPAKTTIDAGAKVQSVPGPGEKPQTFETTKAIEARAAWSGITARTGQPQVMYRGLKEIHFAGAETRLQPGDAILIIGSDREEDLGNERWDLCYIDAVEIDAEAGRTRVTWLEGLGHQSPTVEPAQRGLQVFAMRERAAVFGHNAPDPRILKLKNSALAVGKDWQGFALSESQIDLDAVYPKIVQGSWVVFDSPPYREVSRISRVTTLSQTAFAVSAKCTRIFPDRFENIAQFDRRSTAVLGQSEALELAERPIRDPVYDRTIALGQRVAGLESGQALAISGSRQHLRLRRQAENVQLINDDGASVAVLPGDRLEVMMPPVVPGTTAMQPILPDALMLALVGTPQLVRWELRTEAGFQGAVSLRTDLVELDAPSDKDAVVSELAFIASSDDAVADEDGLTAITLRDALLNCYDRTTLRVNANVAPATHGETVREVMGGGNAGQPYQRFTLKQAPLTYVSAATERGTDSTLEVRVNDLLWNEVPTLYGRGPRERVFVTSTSDDGRTTVQFGDGQSGARPPTGRENVRAQYRKGIGLSGLLATGQLSQLMTRPLGVKGATNPIPATGGDDRDELPAARQNAPLTVLTLGRTVSLRDYEDFARGFAGVAKALATWSWDRDVRRIFITVAGPRGAKIPKESETYTRLVAAIRSAGDPHVTYTVASFQSVTFRVVANVKVDEPTYVRETVLTAIEGALRDRFGFDARSFGQPVELSDVISVIQVVPGVVAVDVDRLYRDDAPGSPTSLPAPRLLAAMPTVAPGGTLVPAELLTLNSAPIAFGTMS
jgi:hypothetical protein